MFDQEFAKWVATLGVGGALAGVIFFFYRKDVSSYINLWKGQSEVLLEVVQENTKVITELTIAVNALQRKLDGVDSRGWEWKKEGRRP